MKKTIIFSIIFIFSLITLGYSYIYNNKYLNIAVTPKEIQQKIFDSLDSEIPATIQIDNEQFTELYNLNNVEDFCINIPMMNISATEIGIIKVKNLNDVNYVKDKLDKRAKTILNDQEKYLNDQYELAKKPLIKAKGKYVIFSISEVNNEIENIFDSFFEVKK
ncbi:MAG: DUF4358 domain-containing protein [Clostridia bacterium]